MMVLVVSPHAKRQIDAFYVDAPKIDVVVHRFGADDYGKFAGSFRPATKCIGGDFIFQYSFFYMSQEVGCNIHLIRLTADFAVFLIDELPRVSEIFTTFGEIGVHLRYRTSFELLIERRAGDADFLGDSYFRQPLLQERLYFTVNSQSNFR